MPLSRTRHNDSGTLAAHGVRSAALQPVSHVSTCSADNESAGGMSKSRTRGDLAGRRQTQLRLEALLDLPSSLCSANKRVKRPHDVRDNVSMFLPRRAMFTENRHLLVRCCYELGGSTMSAISGGGQQHLPRSHLVREGDAHELPRLRAAGDREVRGPCRQHPRLAAAWPGHHPAARQEYRLPFCNQPLQSTGSSSRTQSACRASWASECIWRTKEES